MANTIKCTSSLECIPATGTYGKLPKHGGEQTISQVTAGVSCPQLVTSTTSAAITFPGLTAPRWVRFENIDTTNSIQIGPYVAAAFHPMAELKPGESFPCPIWPTVVLHAKATAGTPKLNCQGLET